MRAHFARNAALGIAFAAASVLSSWPARAAPVSLRSFALQQMKMQAIAYRIGVASAGSCSDRQMLSGLVLHDLSQYDPAVRPAVARAFSLQDGIGVMQIVPGSAADRAGIRVDDEILAIGSRSLLDPSAALRRFKSYARVQQTEDLIDAALRQGPAELLIRRSGALMHVRLSGDPACGGRLSLIDSSNSNAWSDGRQVVVTTAIARLARNDDEIAFVVAHEMAHNILGHSRNSSSQLFGVIFGLSQARRSELAADRLAVELVGRGGYKVEAGADFLRTASRRFWWALSLDHPGFGSRIRAVNASIAAMRGSPSVDRRTMASIPQPASVQVTSELSAKIGVGETSALAEGQSIATELAQASYPTAFAGYFRSARASCER